MFDRRIREYACKRDSVEDVIKRMKPRGLKVLEITRGDYDAHHIIFIETWLRWFRRTFIGSGYTRDLVACLVVPALGCCLSLLLWFAACYLAYAIGWLFAAISR